MTEFWVRKKTICYKKLTDMNLTNTTGHSIDDLKNIYGNDFLNPIPILKNNTFELVPQIKVVMSKDEWSQLSICSRLTIFNFFIKSLTL